MPAIEQRLQVSDKASDDADRPPIELGWLLVSRFSRREQEAISRARDLLQQRLQAQFPQFRWRLPLLRSATAARPSGEAPAEAAQLLEQGLRERDARRWDFAYVITRAELKSYYTPYALAMPSQALAAAAVSVARLLPRTVDNSEPVDLERLAERLCGLCLHLLGDLNGLPHTVPDGSGEASTSAMQRPRGIADLDRLLAFGDAERARLAKALAEVADPRLEERPQSHHLSWLRFYGRAVWHTRDDIIGAVVQAHPWEFPLRLSRLTTAAVSTLLVLVMTAEAWDLGMSQPPLLIGSVSLAALLGASVFILKRQRLWLRHSRARGHHSEQMVISNVAISLVVFLGMATTYFLLLLLTLLLAALLFSHELVAGWAASLQGVIRFEHYLAMAQLVATFGILIGSLGASFEGQYYFRHVAYVDEEL